MLSIEFSPSVSKKINRKLNYLSSVMWIIVICGVILYLVFPE